jgi:alkylation response protein AidB-like acyl-CoA dehydrogenase
MDLELSDEQTWLSDAVATLLTREWAPPPDAPAGTAAERAALWRRLAEFGALTVGADDGLGAVELCLVARALGERLAPVPYLASAAVRYAVAPLGAQAPAGFGGLFGGDDALALALLEPGGRWDADAVRTRIDGAAVTGAKAAVEHLEAADRLAVVARAPDGPALVLVAPAAPGLAAAAQPAFDPTAPLHRVELSGVALGDGDVLDGAAAADALARLAAIGALLTAAEAVGAAGRLLEDACRYAAERRQFGRPIGSFQALRHLLADMYVRQASSWSSVLYAAAALDEDAGDARRTASIAKAYVARAAREVAHGALQVFGGVAMTAEHPAHRRLRRIVVREGQFGDAAHHERAIGRALAAAAVPVPVS